MPDHATINDLSALERAHVLHPSTDLGQLARGDILGFAPPLVLTPNEAGRIVEMTARALDRAHRSL
jgi:hypothetical protein